MEVRIISVCTRAVSRSVSCLTEIIPDFLAFLCNNRLGDGFFDLRELCLPLSDDLDCGNFSFREIRRSQQPVSCDFLIETSTMNAFSLALSHVETVV